MSTLTLLGHRGASHAEPENTLAAFARALDEGADGFECDVRLSADGVPLIVHDPIIGEAVVAATPAADLGLLTLAELARWLADRAPTIVNIELKPVPQPQALVSACSATLEAVAARHTLIVSSFDPRIMPLVTDHRRAFVFEDPKATTVLPLLPPGTDLHPAAAVLTSDSLTAWSAPGRVLRAWTVDRPDEARRLAALGVTTFITNRPGPLRSELEDLVR